MENTPESSSDYSNGNEPENIEKMVFNWADDTRGQLTKVQCLHSGKSRLHAAPPSSAWCTFITFVLAREAIMRRSCVGG